MDVVVEVDKSPGEESFDDVTAQNIQELLMKEESNFESLALPATCDIHAKLFCTPISDYRKLNSVTEFDGYTMPYLQDFAHALHGSENVAEDEFQPPLSQVKLAILLVLNHKKNE
ncbi:hypothetical protein CEXT_768871 [Caerostris extrusa]|uniref:Uncharacterized protein n=1 Tax=Caerostris extrusa TaxID=172846 RepID=A0AAV4V5A2_CAEEX|nr:hypothetical protein CEXT_768871 [Caerostris extrusa]